jgi:hypothetical protein
MRTQEKLNQGEGEKYVENDTRELVTKEWHWGVL